MKKLLLLGAALLSLCAVGQTTARAGGDDSQDYSDQRPAPRQYEGQVVRPRCYLPPPPPVYYAPPVVFVRPYFYHRRFYRPYPYPYAYGYAPGIHIGIGF